MTETTRERWSRRALTIPGVFLGALLLLVLAPLLVVAAVLADLVDQDRGRFRRFLAFGLVYVAAECVGLIAATLIAIARPLLGEDWAERADHRLQAIWASTLLRTGMSILGMSHRFDVEARPGERPLVVFVRHASLIDSLIPAAFLSARHGTRLRYVMKRELLFDPCLDVVGQRTKNAFIRRGAGSVEQETDAIRALGRGLGEHEGALVFPEGTRFSPEKRTRALERLGEAEDAARLARAQDLRHLLPPRSRGALALLEAAEGVDALFLGHRGFEGAATTRDVLAGALIGRHVELTSWIVPAKDIPATPAERLAWLDGEWSRMDRWLEARRLEEEKTPDE